MSVARGMLLKYAQAADELGVPIATLRHWVKVGKLRKVAGTAYISRAELERFTSAKNEPKSPEERRRGPQARTRAASQR